MKGLSLRGSSKRRERPAPAAGTMCKYTHHRFIRREVERPIPKAILWGLYLGGSRDPGLTSSAKAEKTFPRGKRLSQSAGQGGRGDRKHQAPDQPERRIGLERLSRRLHRGKRPARISLVAGKISTPRFLRLSGHQTGSSAKCRSPAKTTIITSLPGPDGRLEPSFPWRFGHECFVPKANQSAHPQGPLA